MLTLSLVTPSRKILTDAAVDEVFVPSFAGELNILEGHAPLMSTLEAGVLRYRLAGESGVHFVAVSWGYLEVSRDRITVLAETAETRAMIDLERAKKAKEEAEKALLGADLEQEAFRKNQLKLERAVLRIQVATGEESATAAAEKRSPTVH